MKRILLVILTASLAIGTQSAQAQSRLTFTSSQDSLLGHGQVVDLTSTLYAFDDISPAGLGRFSLQIHTADFSDTWGITFAVPVGTGDFQVGRYDNAQKFPFQTAGHPGLNLYGPAAYSQLDGYFQVLSFQRTDGVITEASIGFYQHSTLGGTGNASEYGFLNYVAPVPEPATLILGGLGAALLLLFRRPK